MDSTPPLTQNTDTLALEREALRRGLGRSRLAAIAVLVIAAALGAAAMVAALRAQRNATESRERLWESLVSQARAERLSNEMGGRTKALKAIREAAAIRPTEELRDEAIAALSLIDLEVVEEWPGFPEKSNYVIFSPKHTYFAIDHERWIEVRRTDTKERVGRIVKSPNWVTLPFYVKDMCFSPDETLLACSYYGGYVVMWDIAQKRELWRTQSEPEGTEIGDLYFDGINHRFAVGDRPNSRILMFNARDGKQLESIKTSDNLRAIAFSHDGSKITWSDHNATHVIDLETYQQTHTYPLPAQARHAAWAPDNERLAIGFYNDPTIIIDTTTGYILHCDLPVGTVDSLNFTSDGRHLVATGWDGATRFWDSYQGTQRLMTQTGSGKWPARNGNQIGYFRSYSDLGFWKLTPTQVYQGYTSPSNAGLSIDCLEFSPDARWIIGKGRNGRNNLHVWERASGRLVLIKPGGFKSALFGPKGKWLYGNTTTGLKRWPVLDGDSFALGDPELILPDGKNTMERMIHRTHDRQSLNLYSTTGSGLRVDLTATPPTLETVIDTLPVEYGTTRFFESQNDKWAAASFWKERTIQLWNLKTQKMRELDYFGGEAIFLPGDRYLAGGSKRGLILWETDTWEKVKHFPRDASSSVATRVAYSKDGRYVSYENTQRTSTLIDLKTLELIAVFNPPNRGQIMDQTMSDDGRFLAISTDLKVHLWDLPALEQELAKLGLRFGQQLDPPHIASQSKLTPTNAALFAGGILLAALLFGLYSMFYQRHLIRQFDAQYKTLELTQKELLQSEKMKALGTLSAGVAHDFKNLLSVIRLSSGLIKRSADGDEDILEETEAINNAVAQGDQVIKAMLGYSRNKDGQNAQVDVPDVIEGTVALLGQQFLSGIHLQLEVERDLPEVSLPSGALEQILLNLLVNASEAMEQRGELKISAYLVPTLSKKTRVLKPIPAPHYIRVNVADDGVGIDQETITRIFEPFFTTKTMGAEKGTGLGLATIYKICHQNELGLIVESEPDVGTRFSLEIPVVAPERPS